MNVGKNKQLNDDFKEDLIMKYGIEEIMGQNGYEYFGYKENEETNKRTYVCHGFTREFCNQRLEDIAEREAINE